MRLSQTVKIPIGGGDIAASTDALDEIFGPLEKLDDPRLVVMTATNEADGLAANTALSFASAMCGTSSLSISGNGAMHSARPP